MPINFELRDDHIREEWLDVVTADEVRLHFERLLGDHAAMAIRRSLVVVRLTEAAFNGADMEELVRAVVRPALAGLDWRSAVLPQGPLDFGLARQFGQLADGLVELRTFGTEDEALAWLRRPAP